VSTATEMDSLLKELVGGVVVSRERNAEPFEGAGLAISSPDGVITGVLLLLVGLSVGIFVGVFAGFFVGLCVGSGVSLAGYAGASTSNRFIQSMYEKHFKPHVNMHEGCPSSGWQHCASMHSVAHASYPEGLCSLSKRHMPLDNPGGHSPHSSRLARAPSFAGIGISPPCPWPSLMRHAPIRRYAASRNDVILCWLLLLWRYRRR